MTRAAYVGWRAMRRLSPAPVRSGGQLVRPEGFVHPRVLTAPACGAADGRDALRIRRIGREPDQGRESHARRESANTESFHRRYQ